MGNPELRELIAAKLYKEGLVKGSEVYVSDGSKCDIGRLQMTFGSGLTVAAQVRSLPCLTVAAQVRSLPCVTTRCYKALLYALRLHLSPCRISQFMLFLFCSLSHPCPAFSAPVCAATKARHLNWLGLLGASLQNSIHSECVCVLQRRLGVSIGLASCLSSRRKATQTRTVHEAKHRRVCVCVCRTPHIQCMSTHPCSWATLGSTTRRTVALTT